MKTKRILHMTIISTLALSIPLVYNNCVGGYRPAQNSIPQFGGTAIPLSNPLNLTGQEPNVIPITVGCGYANEPCVSVTICKPGSALGSGACVTVPNVLIDSGSYGLRIFADQIPAGISLPAEINSSGQSIAECVSYADNTSDWGPVVSADIYLGNGNEKAPSVPMQIINASYATLPSGCTTPDTYSLASGNPKNVGFNGILGVGGFQTDCGATCANYASNGVYFTCSGATCTNVAVAQTLQVQNPVYFLTPNSASGAADNNGVVFQFPAVSSEGASTLNGSLILGIGTQKDNTPPAGVSVFNADQLGNFQTNYKGQLYSDTSASTSGAFLDTGSDGYFFPDSTISQCSDGSGFYCPSSPENLSATQISSDNSVSDQIFFQIANLLSSQNAVFDNLGGYMPGYFDWGFPFFLGKTVYVGLNGRPSPLGTGPFWGF